MIIFAISGTELLRWENLWAYELLHNADVLGDKNIRLKLEDELMITKDGEDRRTKSIKIPVYNLKMMTDEEWNRLAYKNHLERQEKSYGRAQNIYRL